MPSLLSWQEISALLGPSTARERPPAPGAAGNTGGGGGEGTGSREGGRGRKERQGGGKAVSEMNRILSRCWKVELFLRMEKIRFIGFLIPKV